MVAQSKPGIHLQPEAMDQIYGKMKSGIARADQLANFEASARNNGIPATYILTAWGQFQSDYPLTGDYEHDAKTLKVLSNYYDPKTINEIITGTYIPPSQRTLDKLSEDEFAALSPERQLELIKLNKGAK